MTISYSDSRRSVKVGIWVLLGSIGEHRIKGDTISRDIRYQGDTHAVSPVERSIRKHRHWVEHVGRLCFALWI
jgi:hypothetical protein